jgi:hypothetical protein
MNWWQGFVLFFAVLEPRALYMLGKCSTTEFYPKQHTLFAGKKGKRSAVFFGLRQLIAAIRE